ncbi:ester cyclase [Halobellus clavatus]|uniref:Predicted ester cyclase n=1 Tax=Halobellus clavatus TaxID=660517 RepID=A0A1H3IAY6_9EURY|nr:ester cyclase [Halobellus clavatus]SDY24906.1 Predicted ester cyclase [Halobellus clavatus]
MAAERKHVVHEFSQSIHDVTAESVDDLLEKFYHDDAEWYGPEPLNELNGVESIAQGCWDPLLTAFPDLEKNDYILLEGEFEGEQWVSAAGTLVGTFENDWLDIPATGRTTWIQYGALYRVVDGKIAETRMLFDVLDVMRQAGYRFIPALAPEVVRPGPATQDGLLFDEQDESDSEQTLQLVEDMIFEGLGSYDGENLDVMDMDAYWREDFMWYGPAGIGTTRGVDGFQEFHQGPWLEAFPDRGTGGNTIRVAEGDYCAWTAWPSGEATHRGDGLFGLPSTGETVTFRVIDFWRREGDRLAENWVFIDMIGLLEQFGVDVFERLRNNPESIRWTGTP